MRIQRNSLYAILLLTILIFASCKEKAPAFKVNPKPSTPESETMLEVPETDVTKHEDVIWLTDFKEAQKIAKEKNLLILADFSGSDWCGWCIKLDEEVFSKKKFLNYAKDNFVLLMLDFPKNKKMDKATKLQNNQLSEQYQVRGLPTVLILDADGKVIKQTGYMPGGADAYIKYLKQIKAGLKK